MREFLGGAVSLYASRLRVSITKNEGFALSRSQGETADYAAFVKRQRNTRRQRQRLASSAGLNRSAQPAKRRKRPSIVMPGLKIAGQIHLAGKAGHNAVNLMGSVRRPGLSANFFAVQAHKVGDRDYPGFRSESGNQDVGVR